MRKSSSGFTIVELLIVIVVIAILATITIVAYNGIQQRANNTQTVQAVAQFVKAFGLYASDNGDYPALSGCLGEGYPTYCLSQSGTSDCLSTGSVSAAGVALNNALKPYMNNKVPSPSMQKISCATGTLYIGAYATYQSASKTVIIYMMLNGSGAECPSMSPNAGAPGRAVSGDLVRCLYTLQAVTA